MFLCYRVIDVSGTTFYQENLNKEDRFTSKRRKLVVEGLVESRTIGCTMKDEVILKE